jgi:ABC-type transporter Mla subunit MlaD
MTEQDLAEATSRLARAEGKFLDTVHMLIEALNAVRDYLKENRDHFSSQLHAFDTTEELMKKQIEMLREITKGMELIVKGANENNLALNETNEQMKAVLAKVESYFGNGPGLEYDN